MTFLQEYKTFFFLEVLLHIKKKKMKMRVKIPDNFRILNRKTRVAN